MILGFKIVILLIIPSFAVSVVYIHLFFFLYHYRNTVTTFFYPDYIILLHVHVTPLVCLCMLLYIMCQSPFWV